MRFFLFFFCFLYRGFFWVSEEKDEWTNGLAGSRVLERTFFRLGLGCCDLLECLLGEARKRRESWPTPTPLHHEESGSQQVYGGPKDGNSETIRDIQMMENNKSLTFKIPG